MASTYTTNSGIEKPGIGEQTGTWGSTLNVNFDLIDEAIHGIVSITLTDTGTSGSPNTLAISEGASSNGRNKFIEFVDGGDLGGTAYVQLTPNDAKKIVHIRNSLSTGRNIIIFQGTYNTGRDFEIVNGADVLLKFDGAGSGADVSDINTNLTVTKITAATYANLPAADESENGTIAIADPATVILNTDHTTAVTPYGLATWQGNTAIASVGTVTVGTWNGTPIAANYLAQATDSAKGAVELATQAEVDAGTDPDRVVTCATLANTTIAGVPAATTTTAGKVELATQAEVDAGTDTDRVVVPDTLANFAGTFVTLNGTTATLATANISAGTITATSARETAVSISGSAPAMDCSLGNVFYITQSTNTSYSFSNVPATGTVMSITLILTQGASAYTTTWPDEVLWAGGTAPDVPAAGEINVYTFTTYDGGTTWFGFLAGEAFA